MKVKGVIKNSIFKNLKSDNSKNICRDFYGAVVGNVGSVLCQIVPWSGLYLSSRSVAAPKIHSISINFRVLICCTCHFQGCCPFFVYFGFLFASLFSVLISALTWGGEDGHLFWLTCSVVLWRGRNIANKYRWHVWAMLTLEGPSWVCRSPRCCLLSGSTLLRLQGALWGSFPKWILCFVHFPNLSLSGSWVPHKGTGPDGLPV